MTSFEDIKAQLAQGIELERDINGSLLNIRSHAVAGRAAVRAVIDNLDRAHIEVVQQNQAHLHAARQRAGSIEDVSLQAGTDAQTAHGIFARTVGESSNQHAYEAARLSSGQPEAISQIAGTASTIATDIESLTARTMSDQTHLEGIEAKFSICDEGGREGVSIASAVIDNAEAYWRSL